MSKKYKKLKYLLSGKRLRLRTNIQSLLELYNQNVMPPSLTQASNAFSLIIQTGDAFGLEAENNLINRCTKENKESAKQEQWVRFTKGKSRFHNQWKEKESLSWRRWGQDGQR